MKCKIPEISWHNRDPVLSVDIHPSTEGHGSYRLASGGTDSHVLIWNLVINKESEISFDVVADLTRHQKAVNVVKWSPNGELLASGDDESFVFIWKQKDENETVNILDNDNDSNKENWITLKVLRGHIEDIYDLCWSPNSLFLVSGSVDNTAMIWDIQKGKCISSLNDHKGFVQGVAWDPWNQYIATLSCDRFLRIFDIQTKKVIFRINKSTLKLDNESESSEKRIRLYHDDTLQTFFRRLTFSPDGNFLFSPAGILDYEGAPNIVHATYIYSRYSLKQPSIILPSDQYTVAVKCCPILFKLRKKGNGKPAIIPLPYRIVFAVATKSSVYLYDTQQRVPFGIISNIHYTRLTDITWSSDGRVIIVSSTDGFCSIITFERGELGEQYDNSASIELHKPIATENKAENEVVNNQLILEKDIISSDDNFETPKLTCLPANTINVRRCPRTLINNPPYTQTNDLMLNLDNQTLNPEAPSPTENNKKAKHIAIRRQPRVLIPTSVEKSAIVEEAMDTWPIDIHKGTQQFTEQCENVITDVISVNSRIGDSTSENTQNIKLVYEDTAEESGIVP